MVMVMVVVVVISTFTTTQANPDSFPMHSLTCPLLQLTVSINTNSFKYNCKYIYKQVLTLFTTFLIHALHPIQIRNIQIQKNLQQFYKDSFKWIRFRCILSKLIWTSPWSPALEFRASRWEAAERGTDDTCILVHIHCDILNVFWIQIDIKGRNALISLLSTTLLIIVMTIDNHEWVSKFPRIKVGRLDENQNTHLPEGDGDQTCESHFCLSHFSNIKVHFPNTNEK